MVLNAAGVRLMVGLDAPDKVDLTSPAVSNSIQPDATFSSPRGAARGMTSNGKRARGTNLHRISPTQALAETGGPVLSLIAVKKE